MNPLDEKSRSYATFPIKLVPEKSRMPTGEVRPYNRKSGVFGALPVARDVYHGGFGAVELALRWSVIDLTDAAVDGGEMQIAKFAVTWWLSTRLNLSMNYHSIWNEVGGSKGRANGPRRTGCL